MPKTPPTPYAHTLMAELEAISTDYAAVLERSEIRNIDPNRHGGGGVTWLGYATHGWAPSEGELEAARMALLTREQQAGQTIPLGGAGGLILAYPRSAAPTVEPAVTRAVTKVVGQAEGHHVEALKEAIADAQQKMDQGSG